MFDDLGAVLLLVLVWGGLNLFCVMAAKLQRAQLTVRGRSRAELAAARAEREMLFDELDALYQIDHKEPPLRREWP